MPQFNIPYNNWEDGQVAFSGQVLANFNAILSALNNGIGSDNIADNTVTDAKIGLRTIADTGTPADAALLSAHLNGLANRIKAITGESNWKTDPVKSLRVIDTAVNNAVAFSNTALSNSSTALSTANAANATANAADAKANTAISTADGAVVIANNAVSLANSAIMTADGAENTVLTAVDAANQAISIANQAVVDAQSFAGNTEVIYDVFTIVSANNGDGTFTYNDGTSDIVGTITVEGFQQFVLSDSYYKDRNRIEATINDTLTRSQASGGLQEVGVTGELTNLINLTYSVDAGSEITFKYYKQLSLGGKHALAHGVGGSDELIGLNSVLPVEAFAGQMFFKVVV